MKYKFVEPLSQPVGAIFKEYNALASRHTFIRILMAVARFALVSVSNSVIFAECVE